MPLSTWTLLYVCSSFCLIYNFIYFGCAGSWMLHRRGAWAANCRGFEHCGAQALGTRPR